MKHKIKFALTTLLITLFLLANTMAETVSIGNQNAQISLRKGPGTKYSSIATLKDGDTITIKKIGKIWTQVATKDGKTGYIKNLYIKGKSKTFAAGNTYADKAYTGYTTDKVNMRIGASTKTSVIKTLSKGTKVKVIGKNGSFYLAVTKDGTEGYIAKKYITNKKAPTKTENKNQTITIPELKLGKIITKTAILRKSGKNTAKRIATLKEGQSVIIIKEGKYWNKIDYNNKEGYILKKSVEVITPTND